MGPRAIAPEAIELGDTIRVTRAFARSGDAQRFEFTVVRLGDNEISGADVLVDMYVGGATTTWTLLDRPEPPREPGGAWRDPVTHIYYGCIRDGKGLQYLPFPGSVMSRAAAVVLSDRDYRDRDIIARLVPLDGDR